MRKDLLDILACPMCKGPLLLQSQKEEAGEVVSGTLGCGQCGNQYPIVDAIPRLLPPVPKG